MITVPYAPNQQYTHILRLIDQLPVGERLQLITYIVETVQSGATQPAEQESPWRDPFGMCANMEVSISAEEIDAARKEMWGKFYE